jgi:hypothetical protein
MPLQRIALTEPEPLFAVGYLLQANGFHLDLPQADGSSQSNQPTPYFSQKLEIA